MHIITVVGDQKVGKTALCSLWSSGQVTSSYVSTMDVCHWMLRDLTVHDTPSDQRFCTKLEVYFQSTDVFVLVANEDTDFDSCWALIQPINTRASWLFVWTGKTVCPKRQKWAKEKEIETVVVNLEDKDSALIALERVRNLARSHESRPDRVPFGYYDYFWDEANRWLPCA